MRLLLPSVARLVCCFGSETEMAHILHFFMLSCFQEMLLLYTLFEWVRAEEAWKQCRFFGSTFGLAWSHRDEGEG